jgi:predicted dehydrogenase
MCLGVATAGASCCDHGDRRVSPETQQGLVVDGIQWFDALRWLFGKPTEVSAMGANLYPGPNDSEDVNAALVRMENGAVVQVCIDAFRGPEGTRIDVIGTDGTLCWSAGENRMALHRLGGRERREEHLPVTEGEIDGAELRHFFACVLTGRTPVADGSEGRATLALALAVRRAAKLRRSLALGDDLGRPGRRRGTSPLLRLVHAS